MRVPTAQPVEYDTAFPNPFGGDPFPARVRLSLKEYDQAHHRAVILATASLDPAQMPRIMEKIARGFVEKFIPEMADSMPKDMFKALSVDSKTEVALDLTSGWPESLTYETSMTIEMSVPGSGSKEKVDSGETITMKRIVGDAPPEIPRTAGKWQALLEEAKNLGGKGQLDRAVEVENGRSRSPSGASGRTIPSWPRSWIRSAISTSTRAGTRKRGRSTSARWPSGKRPWARIIPMS